jgi:hypothetical protein
MGPISEQDIIALIREHFEQRLEKLEDAHLAQRLAAMEKLEDARWLAHQEVHRLGQMALDEGVKTVNFRLGTMNEFREQYDAERIEFIRKEVFNSEFKTLESKFESSTDKNSSRVSILENNQSNQAGKVAAYTSMVGAVFVLVQILLHFWK